MIGERKIKCFQIQEGLGDAADAEEMEKERVAPVQGRIQVGSDSIFSSPYPWYIPVQPLHPFFLSI